MSLYFALLTVENNKNKKSVKFQGDILNFGDFIQVFVFTTNHHLNCGIFPLFVTLNIICSFIRHLEVKFTPVSVESFHYLRYSNLCVRYFSPIPWCSACDIL